MIHDQGVPSINEKEKALAPEHVWPVEQRRTHFLGVFLVLARHAVLLNKACQEPHNL